MVAQRLPAASRGGVDGLDKRVTSESAVTRYDGA
jgi:hypothetical protein